MTVNALLVVIAHYKEPLDWITRLPFSTSRILVCAKQGNAGADAKLKLMLIQLSVDSFPPTDNTFFVFIISVGLIG